MSFRLFFYVSCLALFVCLLSACEKDPEAQVVTLNIKAKANGKEFALNEVYTNALGQRYRVNTLLFYLSDLRLLKDDGTEVELFDVILHDFNSPKILTDTLPTGTYTALKFGLGLDSLKNATNPADIAPPNPLSYAVAHYWDWASKYIFAKVEGYVTADATAVPNQAFIFHTGFDDLYRQVSLPRNFEVGKDPAELTLTLDFDKLWNTPQNIDLINNGNTQTFDNFPDALTMVNNFALAFE